MSLARATEPLAIGALSLLAFVLALRLAHPGFLGHDDGVYAATGAALSHEGRYTLVNLPSRPSQTKYPPLYPALLAPVWAAFPDAPENIRMLKAVNAALLVPAAVLFWLLLCTVRGVAAVERVIGTAVFVSSPGVFSFTDLMTTEMAFLVLLMGVLLAIPTAGAISDRRAVIIGVLAALLVLTRMTGLAILAAVILHLWLSRGARTAGLVATTSVLMVVPWFVWRSRAISPAISPLELFYVQYEPSAWQYVWTDPWFTWRVVATNVGVYMRHAAVPFGLYTQSLAVAALGLAVIGAFRQSPDVRRLLATISVSYLSLIVAHPMVMERYLAPLIPLGLLLLVAGTAGVRSWLAARTGGWAVAALLPVMALVAGNAAWLHHCAATMAQGPQWHFGRRATFGWQGFQETFAWVRAETPPNAVLASGFDPAYFLHTGRRAIRPWLHLPESYVAAYGRIPPNVDALDVQQQLDDLGVTFLVVDPAGGQGEGDHARRTMLALVEGPWWTPVFESRDGRHRVYARREDRPLRSPR